MEKEDYLEYLKQKSYDDLVSISFSIDKVAQPARYQMVLSEIAVRDQRGEKPAPTANRQGLGPLVCGGILISLFVEDLVMSRTGWQPVVHIVFGIICLTRAWFRYKKGNDQKPAA